jgi:hypothetical protein
MSGTAFDAILKNLGTAASIKAQSSALQFNNNLALSNYKLAAMAAMLNARQTSNPTSDLAHAVLSQIDPHPVADIQSQSKDNTSQSGLSQALDEIAPIRYLRDIGGAVANSSPGHFALDMLSRSSYAIGTADKKAQELQDSSKGTASDFDKFKAWLSGAGAGLTQGGNNTDNATPSSWVTEQYAKNAPGPVKFATGLAADIGLDPLSYVDPAAGIGALKGLVKGSKAVSTAKKVAPAASEAEALVGKLMPKPGNELSVFEPPRFTASSSGITSDLKNPVVFADHAAASEIHNAVATAPKLAYPNLDVQPLFRNITDETVTRVPKQITEEVQVPIKPEQIASAAKVTSASNSSKLAGLRAVKMHLLQAGDYKINGFSVDQLLDAAKNSPERSGEIEKLINTEAKKIYKSGDFNNLPKIAQLRGRSGNLGAAGLTLKQATQLFEHGKVAKALRSYSEDSDAFTHEFPFHDPEDLDNVFLKNSKGDTVSIKQYLTDLGVPLSSVDKSGTEQLLNKLAPKEDSFKFDFENEQPKTKTVKRTRTVYEEVRQTSTRTKKLSSAEQLKWQMAHSDKLTPQELSYLKSARTPKQFEGRVAELRTKTVAGNIKTLNEFVDAAKAGVIPGEYVDELLKRVGVKNLEQLQTRATAIIKKTGPAAKKFIDREIRPGLIERSRIPVADEDALDPSKLERYKKGKVPGTIWDNVPTASELIEAAKEHPAAIMKELPEVTNSSLEDLSRALPESIVKNLVDPQDVAKYPFLSGRKLAKRTSQTMGEGRARNLRGWNKYSQYDMWKSLVGSASKRNYTVGLHGRELAARLKVRPGIMYNEVMSSMKLGEAALKKAGVKFIAGDQNSGIMMSLTDILDSIDRKSVEKYLFRTGKGVKRVEPTAVMDAAERLVDASLHGGNMDLAQQIALKALQTGGLDDKGATEFLKDIHNALPKILTNVNKNYAQHSIEIGTAVQSMTDQVIHDVITKFADPSVSVGDAFASIINRNSAVSKLGSALKAPTESNGIASTIIDTELVSKGLVQPGDLAEANTARRISNAKTPDDIRKAGVVQQKSREAEAMTLGQMAGETVEDLGDYFDTMIQAGIYRANTPLLEKAQTVAENLGKMFLPGYGYQDIHDALWRSKNVAMTFSRSHRALMSETAKLASQSFGSEAPQKVQEAFKLLQQGVQSQDPAMQNVMAAMGHSVDTMFSGGTAGSFASRNGFFADHVNSLMEFYGVPDTMRFQEGKTLADQAEIWRSWTSVDDPLDALDRAHAAYQAASTDTSVARVFSSKFGSATAKPGYTKLSDKSGKSVLFKYADRNLYYPREAAQQITYYDSIRNAMFKNAKNPNARAMLRIYDKALQAFKTGVTVLRPGHHVSNLMGDMALNFLAGVDNPLAYYKSIRVIKGRASLYADWDGQKALMEGTGVPASIQKGGKITVAGKHTITDDEVWRGAYKQGLLPEFHDIQDITFNDAQDFNKLYSASKLKNAGKKILHAAGKTADAESHFTRMAQFIDALEKSSAKTVQEAFDEAGAAVRKWHPDGTDLTPFERTVMKRAIPFYSWMRKSTPLILQSFAMRPGRAMVIPKTLYNFAQTMGMNPDSISDPFPQDSLLPSWLTENVVGPQWTGSFGPFGGKEGHNYGFTLPGDPVTGTIDSEVNNPISSLLNSLTPFAKVPVELASGHNLATGSAITDRSQYLNQQVPLMSILAGITQKNITPTGLSDNTNVKRGNASAGVNQDAIMNFLTGMGVKDYSNPSYVKAGISELRQQYKNKALRR